MNQLLPVLKAVMFGQKGTLKEGEIDRAKDYSTPELAIEVHSTKRQLLQVNKSAPHETPTEKTEKEVIGPKCLKTIR